MPARRNRPKKVAPRRRSSRSKRPPQPARLASPALRLETAETLGAAYRAWNELVAARQAAAEERRSETDRMTREAAYLLGALDKARQVRLAPAPRTRPKRGALANLDSLAAVQLRAQAEQKEALAALARREKSEETRFARAIDAVRNEILERARTLLRGRGAKLWLTVMPVAGGRAVVHARRPSDDEAVLVCFVLNEKLPTRHAFFADDATEDPTQEPERFYRDEGLIETRPGSADAEDSVIDRPAGFLPVRMHIPMRLPDRKFPRFRLVHRGPEAELESRRAGEPYGHLLPREDAELFTGYMLRLKVEGQLDVSVHVG